MGSPSYGDGSDPCPTCEAATTSLASRYSPIPESPGSPDVPRRKEVPSKVPTSVVSGDVVTENLQMLENVPANMVDSNAVVENAQIKAKERKGCCVIL